MIMKGGDTMKSYWELGYLAGHSRIQSKMNRLLLSGAVVDLLGLRSPVVTVPVVTEFTSESSGTRNPDGGALKSSLS